MGWIFANPRHNNLSIGNSTGNNGRENNTQKDLSQGFVDGFKAREVAQRQWTGLSEVEAVKKALLLLTDYEYINSQISPTSPKGGRPSEKYSINPKLLDDGLNE